MTARSSSCTLRSCVSSSRGRTPSGSCARLRGRRRLLRRDEVLYLHKHLNVGRGDALSPQQGLEDGQKVACVLLGLPYLGNVNLPVDFTRGVHDQPEGMLVVEVGAVDGRLIRESGTRAGCDSEDGHGAEYRQGLLQTSATGLAAWRFWPGRR